MCPFNNGTGTGVGVGDKVMVNLLPYFGFSQLMRITRMVYTVSTGVYDITFGNIVFKPQKPIKKLYKI